MSRFDVVALISSYNEADVIGQVIAHLIEQGSHAYLIDDGSTDDTVKVAANWLGRGLIDIERRPPSDTFDWQAILRRKTALAEELDAAWVIHHDADEFRYAPFQGITLAAGLAHVQALGYNAVDFRVLNFRPVTDEDPNGADLQRSMTFYEPGDIWDDTQVKAWRNRRGVDLATSGGHEAEFENREVFPIQFLVRHYPIRGRGHGHRKVFGERIKRFSQAERSLGWHRQYDDFAAGKPLVWRRDELAAFDEAEVFSQLRAVHRDSSRLHSAHIIHTDLRNQIESKELQVRDLDGALQRSRADYERAEQSAEAAARLAAEELATVKSSLDKCQTDRAIVEAAAVESAKAADQELARLTAELTAIRNSWSWRLTAVLRMVGRLLPRRRD